MYSGLGVHETTGALTHARPVGLQQIRNATGQDGAVGDGLRRQWLNKVAESLLDLDHGLFSVTCDRTLIPNPHSDDCVPDHLAQFVLLGRILSLALFHGEQIARAAYFWFC